MTSSRLAEFDKANGPLDEKDLDQLRRLYEKSSEVEGDVNSTQTKFNYGWALIRSDSRQNQEAGVQMLIQVYRKNDQRRRECLYYLAIGKCKLAEYKEALKFTEALLEKEPNNTQVKALQDEITRQMQNDGLVGLGIVGGLVLTGTILLGMLVKNSRNRS